MTGIDRWIEHWADHRPGHPAVILDDSIVTYRDLARRVGVQADRLRVSGVARGDRVAFCGFNRIEQLEVLLACARIGAVLLPLNNRLAVGELRFQLDDADPALALVADGFGPTVAEAGSPDLTILDADADAGGGAGPRRGEAAAGPPSGGDDPLLLVYTSGTTGRARGAVHTHRSVLFTVLNGVAHQDLTAEDRVLTMLPLFHVGGLNIQTLPALYVGATVILQHRFDPDETLDLIARHRPTQTLVVPAVMASLMAHPDFDRTDLTSLRGVNSGTSVVPEHLIRGFLGRGLPVGQVYGATETGPTSVVLRYEDGADHVGSCGRAALHAELRIVGRDGVDVERGEAGEILIRGPHVFHHYHRLAADTAAAFVDGWYRTGDVGRHDDDGWLFIEDRLGDVLISGGENVYPAEVENTLIEHPAIGAVAVVGRPDDRWGEIPVAFVEPVAPTGDPDQPMPPTVEELRSWCADRLARYKQPREVVVVDELPRTALGKVTKQVLRDRLGR